jgi:hypothetical protein
MKKNLDLISGGLLLVGGLILLMSPLYAALTSLTGGKPLIQIIIGLSSVVVALMIFVDEKRA